MKISLALNQGWWESEILQYIPLISGTKILELFSPRHNQSNFKLFVQRKTQV